MGTQTLSASRSDNNLSEEVAVSHDVKAIHPTFDRKPADALLSDYHYQSDEWERIYDWMIKSAYRT